MNYVQERSKFSRFGKKMISHSIYWELAVYRSEPLMEPDYIIPRDLIHPRIVKRHDYITGASLFERLRG